MLILDMATWREPLKLCGERVVFGFLLLHTASCGLLIAKKKRQSARKERSWKKRKANDFAHWAKPDS